MEWWLNNGYGGLSLFLSVMQLVLRSNSFEFIRKWRTTYVYGVVVKLWICWHFSFSFNNAIGAGILYFKGPYKSPLHPQRKKGQSKLAYKIKRTDARKIRLLDSHKIHNYTLNHFLLKHYFSEELQKIQRTLQYPSMAAGNQIPNDPLLDGPPQLSCCQCHVLDLLFQGRTRVVRQVLPVQLEEFGIPSIWTWTGIIRSGESGLSNFLFSHSIDQHINALFINNPPAVYMRPVWQASSRPAAMTQLLNSATWDSFSGFLMNGHSPAPTPHVLPPVHSAYAPQFPPGPSDMPPQQASQAGFGSFPPLPGP